ncbi:MAG: hypothetical protein ACOX45_01770 [Acutalibacteraceae bacterium]
MNAVKKSNYSIYDLWKAGISGDNPIIYARVTKNDDLTRLKPYLQISEKLRKHSLKTDVVIAFDEGGEYGSPNV